jgi:hypothetical protein
MKRIATLPLEPRLKERYLSLVKSHMHVAHECAAGVASLPDGGAAMAATQAAWRFLNNERVTLPALVEPLREVGRDRTEQLSAPFVLLAHDWCKLSFDDLKRDAVQITHESDVGYELTTSLLISAADGSPLAPMEMHLRTAEGVLSTRSPAPRNRPHLEQVLPTMRASRGWGLSKPILHVIDREADSVDHYRRWNAAGHKYLIRADDRRVLWQGESFLLSEIAKKLREKRHFKRAGVALYHGREEALWVAEAEVVLHRPAKKNVRGKKFSKPGPPLTLRLIVVQVRNRQGHVLAEWLLLTNASVEWAAAELLARCYYWRWRIESFFKLLKSHGHQLEHWLQKTGAAIARRMLVAAMACVVVWQLQADDSPAANEFKTLLVRLSGRQVKSARPHTAPAMLAGLWTLLSMLELLNHYDLRTLKKITRILPFRDTG